MPHGKRAGERCAHLTRDNLCALFEDPRRPQFCIDLAAAPSMCGETDADAMRLLEELERRTRPDTEH